MKPLLYTFVPLILATLAAARAEDPRARTLAPFLDNDVIGVGRLDLTKVDVDRLAHALVADQELAGEVSRSISPWIAALRQAGAKELHLLVILPELLSPTGSPPPVIVPLGPGADAKAIGALLCGNATVKGPVAWPTCATLKNAVFAGSNEALERVRQVVPVDRPELDAALSSLGDTAGELVILPSSDTRRVVEELLPNLPEELGGGPITGLTQGLRWTALGLNPGAEASFSVVVQGKDAAAARSLHQLGKSIVQFVRQSQRTARYAPDFAKVADELSAEVVEDRITMMIDPRRLGLIAAALTGPLRENAARAQCVNNLKQIGLAMHNYLSAHNTFPPAYSVDKAGKPLLSWRVLILPYIEQDALYKEFHLDEPWDSSHNRTLIDKIPPTYRCPLAGVKQADRTRTTYLVPRGKSTIYPGPEGVKIQKITDGTSNTIMVVDAPNNQAVTWTKPDDWTVDPPADLKSIFGQHLGGTNVLFADGSVRFFADTLNPQTLAKLLTRDGGEVVGQDEF